MRHSSHLTLVLILMILICPFLGSFAHGQTSVVESDTQLNINREALLSGSSEQVRIDAATVMLFSDNPGSHEVLLSTLKSENNEAILAICNAVIKSRSNPKSFENKELFSGPLSRLLLKKNQQLATAAAEALLTYDYDQISDHLKSIIDDEQVGIDSKLNVVSALRLQPDVRSVSMLIRLLGHNHREIVSAAEDALKAMGIPVAQDNQTREEIIRDLERKGRDEFLRDWLVRQDSQVRRLRSDVDYWRNLYLGSLDQVYSNIDEDEIRGSFLIGMLNDKKTEVRLWAIEKVSNWRRGTSPRMPKEIGPILLEMISDKSREVRLRTARLLTLMGEINSAEQLLEQIEIETDDEVRAVIFDALGRACYNALLPNSAFKVPHETRIKTLDLAVNYLSEENAQKAQMGADVICKLLEQNGLSGQEVKKYIGFMVDRYKVNSSEELQGYLLEAMGGMCAQSVYRSEAAEMFRPLFIEGLSSRFSSVREAAVDGLIHIDNSGALTYLRREGFTTDGSETVRRKVIELAANVGGAADIAWLLERAEGFPESDLAWQAALRIFRNGSTDLVNTWTERILKQQQLGRSQVIAFLELAERKYLTDNQDTQLKNVRRNLARYTFEAGQYEMAAKYLPMVREFAESKEEKEQALGDLVFSHLKLGNIEGAVKVLENCLLENDLGPENPVVVRLDEYLGGNSEDIEPILVKLSDTLNGDNDRPLWEAQVDSWQGPKELENFRQQELPEDNS